MKNKLGHINNQIKFDNNSVTKIFDISKNHVGHNNFNGKEETHFSIILKTTKKNIDKKLSIHRKINNLLENEFKSGLHALEIKILD